MDYVNIARRVEHKQAMASIRLALDTLAVAGGFAAYAGPGGYLNRACAMGLDGPVTDDDIDAVIQFFESKGEDVNLELCPFAHDSLITAVAKRGFVIKHFVDVLVLPLSSSSVFTPAPPPGVVIESVDKTDEPIVRELVEVNERGFAVEGQSPSRIAIDLTTRSFRLPTSDPIVARAGTEIVGVSGSESSDGLTILYGATVIPKWRGRGIQRALMVARLARGVERGSDLACVMTKPGIATERNASRLGFTMAYTRVAVRLARRAPTA